MFLFLHLQLVVRLYPLHPTVGSILVRVRQMCLWRHWWCVLVCVYLCVCVSLQGRVIKIDVIFPEWFYSLGEWRGKELEVLIYSCACLLQWMQRKKFLFQPDSYVQWSQWLKHPNNSSQLELKINNPKSSADVNDCRKTAHGSAFTTWHKTLKNPAYSSQSVPNYCVYCYFNKSRLCQNGLSFLAGGFSGSFNCQCHCEKTMGFFSPLRAAQYLKEHIKSCCLHNN